MAKGIIFDIKEFSINDGPGARVTVFLKGCPLRCRWCHNPEGLDPKPQYNMQTKRLVGTEWTAEALAERINGYQAFYEDFGGGVTFSGGEPTMQADFLEECAERLTGIHRLLDTSGFCEPVTFAKVARHMDMFYFDLKLIDESEHERYTGVSNRWILMNLEHLIADGRDVTIRMPMIPHITDTRVNLTAAAQLIRSICPKETPVHLLPYNTLAGGKYPIYGMEYPLTDSYRSNLLTDIAWLEYTLKEQGYKVINYVKGE